MRRHLPNTLPHTDCTRRATAGRRNRYIFAAAFVLGPNTIEIINMIPIRWFTIGFSVCWQRKIVFYGAAAPVAPCPGFNYRTTEHIKTYRKSADKPFRGWIPTRINNTDAADIRLNSSWNLCEVASLSIVCLCIRFHIRKLSPTISPNRLYPYSD